jgi:rubrerythrin
VEQKLEEAVSCSPWEEENRVLSQRLEELKDELESLRAELEEKQREIEELKEERKEEVETKEKGSFTPDFVNLVWLCQQCNIPFDKISTVISSCLGFVGKTASHLPSRKTVNNMNLSRLAVAQKQTAVI